jgi:hypothetical protein
MPSFLRELYGDRLINAKGECVATEVRRPFSTEPDATARSYTSKMGTNYHNYWKTGKPAAEHHAPVSMDQSTFQRPASCCELPSFDKGEKAN